jgi:hypothetical protein
VEQKVKVNVAAEGFYHQLFSSDVHRAKEELGRKQLLEVRAEDGKGQKRYHDSLSGGQDSERGLIKAVVSRGEKYVNLGMLVGGDLDLFRSELEKAGNIQK